VALICCVHIRITTLTLFILLRSYTFTSLFILFRLCISISFFNLLGSCTFISLRFLPFPYCPPSLPFRIQDIPLSQDFLSLLHKLETPNAIACKSKNLSCQAVLRLVGIEPKLRADDFIEKVLEFLLLSCRRILIGFGFILITSI